jgi:hypothetical protein
MASSSLLNRAMAFFRSPRGRQLIDRGRRGMNRRGNQGRPGRAHPGNQSKLRTLFARFNRPR